MPVVQTIKDRCKRCYSCVRICPAKAIRVSEGQAEVIRERCIGCGSCVRVCSQNAKRIENGIDGTERLLSAMDPVYAILAPSFPAAFSDIKPGQIIAAIYQLGFAQVTEVALGADLISKKYKDLVDNDIMPIIISTPCPAVVEYIQKYRPELTLFLAPIVSPMIATGRVIKQKLNPKAKVVFIGPCIAKKKEKVDPNVAGIIDEVLTFVELKAMLDAHNIDPQRLPEREFAEPQAQLGRIFPISGGLLRTAALNNDILANDVILTEGNDRCIEVIDKMVEGTVEARFLDILFCNGCINGPQLGVQDSVYHSKNVVANYVRQELAHNGGETTADSLAAFADLELNRKFARETLDLAIPVEEEIKKILALTEKYQPEDELNCGACGYSTCREKAIAVTQGLAEVEMCFPYLVNRLEKMNQDLMEAQEGLIRSARLASMGELASSVAHEINNPLAGSLVYIRLMLKKLEQNKVEKEEMQKFTGYMKTMDVEIARCSEIVKNLLEFARPTHPMINKVSLQELVEKSLFLVKHQIGLQNIEIFQTYEPGLPEIEIDMKQIQQVLLNMFINSAQAMPNGGELRISGRADKKNFVLLEVTDTGCGIAKEHLHRIFDPFFTTKLDKKGTGLGLSVASNIIYNHGGAIEVKSYVGVGTTFIIKLPTKFPADRLQWQQNGVKIPLD